MAASATLELETFSEEWRATEDVLGECAASSQNERARPVCAISREAQLVK